MVKRAFAPEQIINKLREAEVLLSQGATAGEASRKDRSHGANVLPLA